MSATHPPSSDPPRVVFDGRFVRCLVQGRWEYVERVHCTGAVFILAVTAEGRLVLTEQVRIPVGRPVIELPAGLVGDVEEARGEAIEAAALRELLEETGYQAERVERLATGPISAGLTSEIITIVRAEGLTKRGPGGGTGSEAITVHEIPLDEVRGWLRAAEAQGKLVDLKIYAALDLLGRASG